MDNLRLPEKIGDICVSRHDTGVVGKGDFQIPLVQKDEIIIPETGLEAICHLQTGKHFIACYHPKARTFRYILFGVDSGPFAEGLTSRYFEIYENNKDKPEYFFDALIPEIIVEAGKLAKAVPIRQGDICLARIAGSIKEAEELFHADDFPYDYCDDGWHHEKTVRSFRMYFSKLLVTGELLPCIINRVSVKYDSSASKKLISDKRKYYLIKGTLAYRHTPLVDASDGFYLIAPTKGIRPVEERLWKRSKHLYS